MDAITDEAIVRISSLFHPTLYLPPSSVAYIQFLLKSYAEVLEPVNDIEAIREWVPLAFPRELGKRVLSEMEKAIAKAAWTEVDAYNEAVIGKNAVIEYIVAEILELAGNKLRGTNSSIILPWDIQSMIASYEELAEMLGVGANDTQLPVTVTIQNNQYIHMMSIEFAMGLLLFSEPIIGNINFEPTMFGALLTSEYMAEILDPDAYDTYIYKRFIIDNPDLHNLKYNFTVYIEPWTLGFYTPDLMQGFATGAQWVGVDHHNYWEDLTQITYTDGKIVQTKITF